MSTDPTTALKVQISILEGDIEAVEDKITATEQKIDEATRTKIHKDIDYWRAEKAQLRTKEAQLRDQLKRKEEQLQGGNDVRERLQKVEAALGAARGLFTTVFRFLPSTSASSQSQQPKRKRKEEREAFRAAVFHHYNAWDEDHANVKLHFPDISVPKAHACAAHIFPRRWGPHMPEHLEMEDVNSPTNALILMKPIQIAFDRGQLTFLYKTEENSLFMKLLDESIASTTMAEASAAYSKDPFSHIPQLPGSVAAMTYKDYDRMPLVFPNFVPAKRCLDFHARLAVLNAEREEWIDEGEVDVSPYGSEGEYKDRLELLLGKMHD